VEKEKTDEMEVAAKEDEAREKKEKTAKNGCCALKIYRISGLIESYLYPLSIL
jgi:hypothetical protein